MGLPNTVNQLFNGGSPYYIVNRSLRFRSSASAYLNRTPSVAGNQQKFTLSVWAKRGALGNGSVTSVIMSAYDGSSTSQGGVLFDTNDTLTFYTGGSGSYGRITTSAVFRDPSAWYHIIAVCDTTQATATNRMALYVNGVSQTVTFNNTPAQNYNGQWNSTVTHTISKYASGSSNFDGYLAEFNYIDGQALTPSSFGAFDTNGIWQPIRYAGTYGTNGFYLPFKNTTSTTTLVADASGNGNNWTPNNISLTAGTTYDSMIDSPTVSASSSNYAVLLPTATNGTVTNGNLTCSSNAQTIWGSMAVSSGKWYWEFTLSALFGTNYAGVYYTPTGGLNPAIGGGWGSEARTYRSSGNKNNGSDSAYGATYTTGDIIGTALDMDAGTITFYKNGVSQGVAFSDLAGQNWYPMFYGQSGGTTTYNVNFGQRPFSYTPPSGYNALNTANLPQPLISNGANYMAATLYTGTGSSQAIANSQSNGGNNAANRTFQPDFVWIKNRDNNAYHWLTDSVRGITNYLSSNDTIADQSASDAVTALNSNGFTLGVNTSGTYTTGGMNYNGRTFVGWQWKGGGTGVTNTSGTITSTVSANTTAGFSVVTYTGNGTNGATVGHGLGVAPNLILIKNRSSVSSWLVYSSVIGASNFLVLNATDASAASALPFNNTSPTSSVFSLGTSGGTNVNGSNFVAYCFAAVNNYSSFGSYTGNGSSDGPFIFTGHRPRWVMVKKSSAIGNWLIFDTSRSPFNVNDDALFPNLSNAETTTSSYNNDFLSNGFKIRTSDGSWNDSGVTYIYASFAENPFSIARAR